MKHNNIYRVYSYTVEMDNFGGGGRAASGFAMASSAKVAMASVRGQISEVMSSFAGTEVDGGTVITKGNEVIYCSYGDNAKSIIKTVRGF